MNSFVFLFPETTTSVTRNALFLRVSGRTVMLVSPMAVDVVSWASRRLNERNKTRGNNTGNTFIPYYHLYVQVSDQVIVVLFELIGILLFAEIITNNVFVPLESGHNIGYFYLVDFDGNHHQAGIGFRISIQLCNVGVVGFYQPADLTERKMPFICFQYNDAT